MSLSLPCDGEGRLNLGGLSTLGGILGFAAIIGSFDSALLLDRPPLSMEEKLVSLSESVHGPSNGGCSSESRHMRLLRSTSAALLLLLLTGLTGSLVTEELVTDDPATLPALVSGWNLTPSVAGGTGALGLDAERDWEAARGRDMEREEERGAERERDRRRAAPPPLSSSPPPPPPVVERGGGGGSGPREEAQMIADVDASVPREERWEYTERSSSSSSSRPLTFSMSREARAREEGRAREEVER